MVTLSGGQVTRGWGDTRTCSGMRRHDGKPSKGVDEHLNRLMHITTTKFTPYPSLFTHLPDEQQPAPTPPYNQHLAQNTKYQIARAVAIFFQ